MPNFESFGKLFIVTGVVLVALGVLFLFVKHIPFLGRLPGDLLIQRENFTFYFPVATSIILSVVLSIILYLISKK